jgi:hypothetical protein
MKNKVLIFLVLAFLGMARPAWAATTYYLRSVGGNWATNTTWSLTTNGSPVGAGIFPVAGDTAIADVNSSTALLVVAAITNCSIFNATGFTGTMNFNATLNETGGITFGSGMTLNANSSGQLNITNNQTIISNTKTFPGKVYFKGSNITVTMGDNWTVTGVVTSAASGIPYNMYLNRTSPSLGNQMICNGGIYVANDINRGNATWILGGGAWNGSGTMYSDLAINCSSASLSGSAVFFQTGTLNYTAGTMTTTGTELNLLGDCTLDTDRGTSRVIWSSVRLSNTANYTLNSDFNCSGTLLTINNIKFTGAYNISCGNFSFIPGTIKTFTIPAGQTLTATNSILANGDASGTSLPLINSSISGTASYLTYLGTAGNCRMFEIKLTDINGTYSTSDVGVWYGGPMTRTANISNYTLVNITGGATAAGAAGNTGMFRGLM